MTAMVHFAGRSSWYAGRAGGLYAGRTAADAARSILLVGTEYLDDSSFTVTRAGTATRRNSSGLIETVAANTPRFDHDANGNPLGLLVEESRTNLLKYSEQFDNAVWIATAASISVNSAVAPDGTATAAKLVESTDNARHTIRQVVTKAASAITYTCSVFLRPAGRNFARVAITNGTESAYAAFYVNLVTGELSEASESGFSGSTATAELRSDGFVRVTVTTTTDTDTVVQAWFRTADSLSNQVYTGDGASGIYIWGAQLEAGSFATSYIPTEGSTVTRNADDIVCTDLAAIGWNASEGTVYVEGTTAPGFDNAQYVYSLEDGTLNEAVTLRRESSTNLTGLVLDGGSARATFIDSLAVNTSFKHAFAFASNDAAAALNGGTPQTDATVTLPTVDRLYIGSRSTRAFGGHIRELRYYPTRLPNAQLQSLTA